MWDKKFFLSGFWLFLVCLRSKFKVFNPERSEGLKTLKGLKTNKKDQTHSIQLFIQNDTHASCIYKIQLQPKTIFSVRFDIIKILNLLFLVAVTFFFTSVTQSKNCVNRKSGKKKETTKQNSFFTSLFQFKQSVFYVYTADNLPKVWFHLAAVSSLSLVG